MPKRRDEDFETPAKLKNDNGDLEEGRLFELREMLRGRILGTSDQIKLAAAVASARSQRARMRVFEPTAFDSTIPFRAKQQIIPIGDEELSVVTTENPSRDLTFGSTGEFIKVTPERRFHAAVLRVPLNKRKISHLDLTTLFIAWWNERDERWLLVASSGYNAEPGYAFARVTRPGIYTVVGLPRDPRVRTTLQLLYDITAWMGADDQFRFTKRICDLILCNPAMNDAVRNFIKTGKGLEQLGFEKHNFSTSLGMDLCRMCADIPHLSGVVELSILDFLASQLPSAPSVLLQPRPYPGWVSQGPDNVPGRITSLGVDPSASNVLFAGGADGGVFKSVNGGGGWYPLWTVQPSLAIGCLSVAPSNPSIVYAATGEWVGAIRANNHFTGVGVLRSSDGGSSWDIPLPLPSKSTAAIAIDPTNSNRLFIAGESSLHRSTNGGTSWDVTPGNTYGIFDGAISDVVIDPNDFNRIYIGVHRNGVFRSVNSGDTWERMLSTSPFPDYNALAPKIALGRNGIHGSQFIAIKIGTSIFTSTDGGTSFTSQADCDSPLPASLTDEYFAWASVIAVDPSNEQVLLGGHFSIFRSTDGGGSWTLAGANVHSDMQAIIFDPNNKNHLYLATDGGVYESVDNGQSWLPKSTGLVTTQCWTVGVSEGPALAYATTTQDNACFKRTSGNSYSEILNSEGGWIEFDPVNPNTIYADTWFTHVMKSNDGGATWVDLGIDSPAVLDTELLRIARTNTNRLLLITTSGVSLSLDGGASWTPTQLGLLAGLSIITATQFAPSDENHAYAASNDGRVWHSSDGGSSWMELPTANLPRARIREVAVDWTDPLRVYVGFATLGARHLWRGDLDSSNNVSWFDVNGTISETSLPDLAMTGVVLHPDYEGTIFVSNTLGVYRSIDGGESWLPFDYGLPNCVVSDLDIRGGFFNRSLHVSTMGRGLYSLFLGSPFARPPIDPTI